MHAAWVFVHLVGAALWLGGLVFLGALVLVSYRSLEREQFRALVRLAGRTLAGVSVLAGILLAVSGLVLAGELHWPRLARDKVGLGIALVVATAVHTLTGRRTDSRRLVITSRALSLFIFALTLAAFAIGVRLAEAS